MQERNLPWPLENIQDSSAVVGMLIRFRMTGESWAVSVAEALSFVRREEDLETYQGQELIDKLSAIAAYNSFLKNVKEAELISQTGTKPVNELIALLPILEQAETIAVNYEQQTTVKELIEKDPLGIELLEYKLFEELKKAALQEKSGKLRKLLDNWSDISNPSEILLQLLKSDQSARLLAFEEYVYVIELIRDRLDELDKKINEL